VKLKNKLNYKKLYKYIYMSDSEYSSVRSINSTARKSKRGKKSRSGSKRKGSKGSKRKGSKGSKRKGRKSKGRENVDGFINSVLSDVMPQNQGQRMNGLSNPMNLQYDPLHVNFMVSSNGQSAPSQFDMSAMGMMGGQMNNGLAQQFQGMMPQGMDMMPQGMDMGMMPQGMDMMPQGMDHGVEQPMMMPQMNQKNLVDIPDVSDAAPQIGGGHVNIPYGLYF
jgi:hypothetical protein